MAYDRVVEAQSHRGYKSTLPLGFSRNTIENVTQSDLELIRRTKSLVLEIDSVGSTPQLIDNLEQGASQVIFPHVVFRKLARHIHDHWVERYPNLRDNLTIYLQPIEGDKTVIDISIVDDPDNLLRTITNHLITLVSAINNHSQATGLGLPVRVSVWDLSHTKDSFVNLYGDNGSTITEYDLDSVEPIARFSAEDLTTSQNPLNVEGIIGDLGIEMRQIEYALTLVLVIPHDSDAQTYKQFVEATIIQLRVLFPDIKMQISPTADKRIVFANAQLKLNDALSLNEKLKGLFASLREVNSNMGASYTVSPQMEILFGDESVNLGAAPSWTAKNAKPGEIVAVGSAISFMPHDHIPTNITEAWGNGAKAMMLKQEVTLAEVQQQLLARFAVHSFAQTTDINSLNNVVVRSAHKVPDMFEAYEYIGYQGAGDRRELARMFLAENKHDRQLMALLVAVLRMGGVVSRETLEVIQKNSGRGENALFDMLQQIIDAGLVFEVTSEQNGDTRYVMQKGLERALDELLLIDPFVYSEGTLQNIQQLLEKEYVQTTATLGQGNIIARHTGLVNGATNPRLVIELLNLSIAMGKADGSILLLAMAAVHTAYEESHPELSKLLQLVASPIIPKQPVDNFEALDVENPFHENQVHIRRFYCACMIMLRYRFNLDIQTEELEVELKKYFESGFGNDALNIEIEALAISRLRNGDKNAPIEALSVQDVLATERFRVEGFAERVRNASHAEIMTLMIEGFKYWGDGFSILFEEERYEDVIKLCIAFFHCATKNTTILSGSVGPEKLQVYVAVSQYFLDIIAKAEALNGKQMPGIYKCKLELNRFFLGILMWVRRKYFQEGQSLSNDELYDIKQLEDTLTTLLEEIDVDSRAHIAGEITKRLTETSVLTVSEQEYLEEFNKLYDDAINVLRLAFAVGDATAVMFALNNISNLIVEAPTNHPLIEIKNLQAVIQELDKVENPSQIWHYLDRPTRLNQIDTIVGIINRAFRLGIAIPTEGSIVTILSEAKKQGVEVPKTIEFLLVNVEEV